MLITVDTFHASKRIHRLPITTMQKTVDPAAAIADLAAAHHAWVFDRLRYVPALVPLGYNGVYYCNQTTNKWAKCSDPELEQLVISTLRSSPAFDNAQVNYFCSRSGRQDVARRIAAKYTDAGFLTTLDAAPHAFPCENGIFQMPLKNFRNMYVAEGIATTSGWEYIRELASENRRDVDEYLMRLFPVEPERRAILTYLASLLFASEPIGQVVMLTSDHTDSGQSTFIQLLEVFFGDLCLTANFASGLASKVASGSAYANFLLQKFKSVRLVTASEVAADELPAVSAIMQTLPHAGMVIELGKLPVPQVHANLDVLHIPMRARFVRGGSVSDEEGEYVYRAETGIHEKTKTWAPAFMDVLLEHVTPDN